MNLYREIVFKFVQRYFAIAIETEVEKHPEFC